MARSGGGAGSTSGIMVVLSPDELTSATFRKSGSRCVPVSETFLVLRLFS